MSNIYFHLTQHFALLLAEIPSDSVSGFPRSDKRVLQISFCKLIQCKFCCQNILFSCLYNELKEDLGHDDTSHQGIIFLKSPDLILC